MSDGVFAIVVTLLVLEITVPHVAEHESMAELARALGFVLARWHLHRHSDLLQEDVDRTAFRTGTMYSIVMGPVAYAIGAGLAWVSQIGAFICYGAIACYFVFPHAVRSRPFRRGTGQ